MSGRQSSGEEAHWTDADYGFMHRALQLARMSIQAGEVPVGAVLVLDGKIVGEGHNRPVALLDPTSHAETEALRAAGKHLANYRLNGSVLYVTVEPCVMCAGAIVLARIEKLVFGTRDLRFGGVRSKFRLADSEILNHRVEVCEGLLATESATLIRDFFEQRRSSAQPGY